MRLAFEKQGIGLLIDEDADNRLRLRLRADFALYVDQITPEEILAVLLQLRNDDREAEAKRRGSSQFEGFVLSALTAEDHRNLIKLLGTDPTVPAAAGPKTADKSLKVTKEHGSSQPLAAVPSATKVPDRLALVVAYDLGHSGSGSREVKRFLENRKERPAGTMPVLLVLKKNKG